MGGLHVRSLAHRTPSSNHPGGVVASFCDGHSRFISEDIDYKVYLKLLTPNGPDSDMPLAWRGR